MSKATQCYADPLSAVNPAIYYFGAPPLDDKSIKCERGWGISTAQLTTEGNDGVASAILEAIRIYFRRQDLAGNRLGIIEPIRISSAASMFLDTFTGRCAVSCGRILGKRFPGKKTRLIVTLLAVEVDYASYLSALEMFDSCRGSVAFIPGLLPSPYGVWRETNGGDPQPWVGFANN